ncbi:MAG: hypothetical protein V7701_11865, partial [Sneathiella sp.]
MAFWSAHFPILVVVIPLLSAAVCALLKGKSLPWALTTIISAVSFLISIQLILAVNATGPISYELGSWAPPWGIEYLVDPLNAFLLLIISGISTGVLLYARESIASEVPEKQQGLFYAAYLLALTGMMGICITGDAFNIFVFLEIMSLSSYVL